MLPMSHSASDPHSPQHRRRRPGQKKQAAVGEPACSALWSPCYWPPPCWPLPSASPGCSWRFSAGHWPITNAMAGRSALFGGKPRPDFSEGLAPAPDGPWTLGEQLDHHRGLELETARSHLATANHKRRNRCRQAIQPLPASSAQFDLAQAAAQAQRDLGPCDWRIPLQNGNRSGA